MWTIRQSQMDVFADDTLQQVLARVSHNVATAYPEVRAALGSDGYAAWVSDLVEGAMALDITREENVQRFVEWHAMVGVETSLAEAFPWALDMLRVAGEREDDRVAAVDLRMQGLDADEG